MKESKIKSNEPNKTGDSFESEDINILALIVGLWKYKNKILLKTFFVLFLLLVSAGIIYLVLPKYTVVKLPFSLSFQGIDKHQYPNGMKFSIHDIISTPVLQTLYDKYNLKEFISFPDFKASFIIKQKNDKLKELEKEFNAKLDDKKLTYADRKAIEDEFSKRKSVLRSNIYYLEYINNNNLTTPVPKDIIEDLLNDILITWAQQAEEKRHVLNYRNNLLSPQVIDNAEIEKFDYLIAADMLHMFLNATTGNLKYIRSLPGGDKVKIDGKSANDYIFDMQKLKAFYLDQSVRSIATYALYKDKDLVKVYIDSRLIDLERNKQELEKKKTLYDTSIVTYTSTANGGINRSNKEQNKSFLSPSNPVITQLGDSFFDNIIALAQKGNDTKFRQNLTSSAIDTGRMSIEADKSIDFYKTFLKDIEDTRKISPEMKAKLTKKLNEDFIYMQKSMVDALGFSNKAYLEISKQNLSPQAELFNITDGVTGNSVAKFSLKKLLVFVFLFWILISIILIAKVISDEKIIYNAMHS
jgi:hypothetical protein